MSTTPRDQAILAAQKYIAAQPLYLDTETTGLSDGSEIVEIFIADQFGGALLHSLVHPLKPIPWDAERVHGISNEMVKSAPPWSEIWPQASALLEGRYIGIYNAEYDLRLIRQTNAQHRINWQPSNDTTFFCIMRLYAQFYGARDLQRGTYRYQSLDFAGRQLRIALPNTHRAADDTRLARLVLHQMASYPSSA